MKKVSVWLLVLTLLFLTACQPTVSSAPPSAVTESTAATTVTTPSFSHLTSDEWGIYNVTGTGMEKPADRTPSVTEYVVNLYFEEKNGKIILSDWLTDTALQAEVHAFITAAESELKTLTNLRVRGSAVAVNGYLSVRLSAGSAVRTALYDLTAKKRIAFSDLFFKGVHFIDSLNEAMRRTIHYSNDVPDAYYEEPTFYGFPQGHQDFTVQHVSWGMGYQDYSVPMSELYSLSVLSIANDMQGVFNDTERVVCTVSHLPADVEWYSLSQKIGVALPRAETYGEAVYKAVKESAQRRFTDRWSIEAMRKRFGNEIQTALDPLFSLYEIGSRRLMLRGGHDTYTEGSMTSPSLYETVFFDRHTGAEASFTELLTDDWQEHAYFELENTSFAKKEGTAADMEGRFLASVRNEEGKLIFVLDTERGDTLWRYCNVHVPAECIKQ